MNKQKKPHKSKKNRKLLPLAAGLVVLAVLVVCMVMVRNTPPRGWVKQQPLPDYYSLYTPSEWSVDKSTSYWQALEPGEGNFSVSFGNTSPLVSVKDGASTYSSVWVAKLGKDGKVTDIIKNPICDKEGEIVTAHGGFYRCGPSGYQTIAVAIDVTDYTQSKYYDTIAGRNYDASDVTCTQGKSQKYEVEKTCEQVVKTFQKLKEF